MFEYNSFDSTSKHVDFLDFFACCDIINNFTDRKNK